MNDLNEIIDNLIGKLNMYIWFMYIEEFMILELLSTLEKVTLNKFNLYISMWIKQSSDKFRSFLYTLVLYTSNIDIDVNCFHIKVNQAAKTLI